MRSTTPESQLPSIKECAHILARCSVNNHTIADDVNFGPAPGACAPCTPCWLVAGTAPAAAG